MSEKIKHLVEPIAPQTRKSFEQLRQPGQFSLEEQIGSVTALTSPSSILRSVAAIHGVEDPDIRNVSVKLIQGGVKYCIFKITPSDSGGNEMPYVLSVGRSSELSDEVVEDGVQLKNYRTDLESRRLPLFIPKQGEVELKGVYAGFTTEYLDHHYEVGMRIPYFGNSEYFSGQCIFNSPNDEAVSYNVDQYLGWNDQVAAQGFIGPSDTVACYSVASGAGISDSIFDTSSFNCNEVFASEMVQALYILWNISGGRPHDFNVNAGDFVGDPMTVGNNFDLKLTTIRGGLLPQSEAQLLQFMSNHVTVYQGAVSSVQFRTFSNAAVQVGVLQAKELLAQ